MEELIQIFTNLDFNWSILESLAVLFSVIYVILAAKENILCWASAIISSTLYIYICYTAELFPETGLQIFYLLISVLGYLMWNKTDKEQIKQWSEHKHLLIIFIGGIISFLVGFYFSIYTESKMPIIDSFTTTFAIISTYMVVKKVLGNWLYWIVIDFVSAYIYFNRDLHLSSILFLVYTIVAIFGYFSWVKKMENA